MSYGDDIETYPSLEAYREAKGGNVGIIEAKQLQGERGRFTPDAEIDPAWDETEFFKASDSPALKRRRAAADKETRERHRLNGTLEQYEAAKQKEEDLRAEREALEAKAREEIAAEDEEARLERVKDRIRRSGEAVPG